MDDLNKPVEISIQQVDQTLSKKNIAISILFSFCIRKDSSSFVPGVIILTTSLFTIALYPLFFAS